MTTDCPTLTTTSPGRRETRRPAAARTRMTVWPTTIHGGSSCPSLPWSSESSPSSQTPKLPQPWATTPTPAWLCPTPSLTTRRMTGLSSGLRSRRSFPLVLRRGRAASAGGARVTSHLSPSGQWGGQAGCLAQCGPWTSPTSRRRSWRRSPAEGDWSLSSRATCTKSPPLGFTRGSTWLCAVTAWWLTTLPSKPTLTMWTVKKSSWATSPWKFRARSRQGWRLQARGQHPVTSVTRRTWLLNSASRSRTRTVTTRNGIKGSDSPLSPSPPWRTSSWSPWTAPCGSSRWSPWRRWRTGRRPSRGRSWTHCAVGRSSTSTTSGMTSRATPSVLTAPWTARTGPASTSASSSASSAPASTGTSAPTSPRWGRSAWTAGVRWTSRLWRTSGTPRPISTGREISGPVSSRYRSPPGRTKSTSSRQSTARSHSAHSTILIWPKKTL